MSYSFHVTAQSKDEAKVSASREFDSIVAIQPYHSKDRSAALAAIGASIDMLEDDPTQDICVEAWGSLSWRDDPDHLIGATIHAAAWYVARGA